ncbi:MULTISPECIES: DUF1177 domain-containing protein [unclassified Clostridioides]|uniref:DUF1177 domain-containing protein n=1 Tax=unclassified Clostridioides TaxID=2635829 RepID=UPI001D0C0970|nr:DUF1177 domain-containing protein [Clostridioides sp. ES-S-0001-02]MCC0640743.1 DUF1177 domain-containing protein [Clostridioides sp. ES-S-0049-03]MCC0653284.1 DUF1177 domain-containing protein [Clostridioides sp. ES-S-0001-03]MCC0656708.1 DUF1177 domain-containing protein [Clostridioides sp. ES-S-0123-01]MCC0672099.1 DUF1177 domain-containing protein [Clostridioides sp. ES-S-0145-01]MCC0676087.1 DUF1177 domain-containing protein [Clostridioides sp. ES-W-0018-02]MCC0681418.1 DUF1177 domain
MILKQVLEVYDILDKSTASGEEVKTYLQSYGGENIIVKKLSSSKGSTDLVKLTIAGKNGKLNGGNAPTLGILGRLGGIGARPDVIGFVSDGDGALVAISVAAKLLDMQRKGDVLEGDIIISTHICPDAPTKEHYPTPFMDSPIDMTTMNENEVDSSCDAILSIDTTKGNRIINTRGFAISPTVKEGYILKTSDNLLDIIQTVTGKSPFVFPLSIQDITPYGNDLYHLNSILQPAVATNSPVVGVAITTEMPVAGCATGATHFSDLESAGRFAIEVGKLFGVNKCDFYDKEEWDILIKRYGKLNAFQTFGIQ